MDTMGELNIERDEAVYTADGTEAGRVKHVIVDRATRQLTDLVIQRDDEEVMVPISAVERGAQHALMIRTAPTHGNTMHFVREQYHEVDEDEITGMSVGTRAGGEVVERADDDSVVVDDAATARRRPATGRTDRAVDTGNNITVPVVEEQLKAGVREVEGGRFRLAKTVTNEQQTIEVPVEREEVYVTERAVNRPATEADLNMRERDIEIPLRQQEVVTQKQAVVTGEVNIRKETVTDTERVTDTVRREEVHVEDANSARVHIEGSRNLSGDQRARYDAMSPNIRARYGSLTDAQRSEYDRRYPLRRDHAGSILDPDGDGENAFEELGRNITEGTDRPGNRNR